MIAVSIVSHGHGVMVPRLVEQLLIFPEVAQVLVTLNIPEKLALPSDERILVLENAQPKGFAANHNAAFVACTVDFFCPLNPDIEFLGNPFQTLLIAMGQHGVGMVAPRVDSPDGQHEDSWRHFPTLRSLLSKVFGGADGRYALPVDGRPFAPEWVAGMFMLFRSDSFRRLGGFDDGFFLYYEDVDICVRLWKAGYRLLACPAVGVVHDARRDSHRRWPHLRWHFVSMVRYFTKHWGRLPRCTGDLR